MGSSLLILTIYKRILQFDIKLIIYYIENIIFTTISNVSSAITDIFERKKNSMCVYIFKNIALTIFKIIWLTKFERENY